MCLLDNYQKHGYVVIRNLFDQHQLDEVEFVLRSSHEIWKKDNHEFYQQRAINSSGLTSKNYLDNAQQLKLFEFIASSALLRIVEKLIPAPAFLNTQLFFDPVNTEQQNYWHRDIQYDLSLNEQKALILANSSMPHFRIPLKSEKGIELIPGTHKRWDTPEELEVRTGNNGKMPHHELPDGLVIEVNRGDLLIFSGKMLHRGKYGGDRFALDVLYAEQKSPYLKSVNSDCLPSCQQAIHLPNKIIFERSRSLE